MKLRKLHIANFLSVKEASLKLADKGLVSIEGVNEDKAASDSNGAGKSSIINAILWCNYGSYGKDEGADDVVNSQAGKNCMVSCEWECYVDKCLYRIRRYRKDSKHKNNLYVEQTWGGGWNDISKGTAAETQLLINQILGGDETIFRAQCFAQQENPLDIPAMKDRELKELLERCLPFEDLTDKYEEAKEKVNTQKALVNNLELKIITEGYKVEHAKREGKAAVEEFKRYETQTSTYVSDCEIQIDGKRKALSVVQTLAATLSDIQAETKILLDESTTLGDTDLALNNYKINTKCDQIDKLRKRVIKDGTKCHSCDQIIMNAVESNKRIQAEIDSLSDDVHKLDDAAVAIKSNRAKKHQIDIKLNELRTKEDEAKSAEAMVERLEAEIKGLELSKDAVRVNPYQAAIDRQKTALEAANGAIKGLEADLAAAQERLTVLEAVQLTFSPKGVRYHILERLAPKLTEATNHYLKTLTDGAISAVWSTVSKTKAGEYREKFSIAAKYDGRTKFGLLSGGEKRKVRLACFFALQDIIASQATKNIEIWCGDEIDHALDGTGLERLMVLLEEKARTKSTILVISHNEMREWIPNYATVTRKDGLTTITGYLNDY